jgi:ribonuclease HI
MGTRVMAQRRVKIFFDGGCRPNPGRMEAAVVVRGAVHLFDDLGIGTNSDAEWLALIRALELAQRLGLKNCELIGDAAQVIDQANDALRSSRNLQGHAANFRAVAGTSPPARIRWIRRAQNLAGIALAARHPR